MSRTLSAGFPSYLQPVSNEIISAEALPCETAFFLQVQLVGSDVWLPKAHNTPPDVDVESARSHAKSWSWKKLSLDFDAVFPTLPYCL